MITATVRRTIRERGLLSAGDHVLVACSGGPDSTALLHVLHRLRGDLGITLCTASIDHGLRPESAEEVAQVGAFAGSLGVPFVAARVDVSAEGPSLQARARDDRYLALHELASSQSAGVVAVGHTQDDQAETVLARMLRGAGLRGLGGIEPRRADGVGMQSEGSKRDVATAAREPRPFLYLKPAALPLSVKIRLGFEDSHRFLDVVRGVSAAGPGELVIHARTRAGAHGATC